MAGGGKGGGGGKKSAALAGDIGGGARSGCNDDLPSSLVRGFLERQRKRTPLVPHFKCTIKGEEAMAPSFAKKWLFLREENEEATSSSKNIVFALLSLSLSPPPRPPFAPFPCLITPIFIQRAFASLPFFPPSEGSSSGASPLPMPSTSEPPLSRRPPPCDFFPPPSASFPCQRRKKLSRDEGAKKNRKMEESSPFGRKKTVQGEYCSLSTMLGETWLWKPGHQLPLLCCSAVHKSLLWQLGRSSYRYSK